MLNLLKDQLYPPERNDGEASGEASQKGHHSFLSHVEGVTHLSKRDARNTKGTRGTPE
jgi:hypothetical protein